MPAAIEKRLKYGLKWDADTDDLKIEFAMIRKGGKFELNGRQWGEGLMFHYKAAQTLMWPEDDHHRWSDLILSEILNNSVTAILGPKDSGKTHSSAKYALTDYFVFPQETLILMSSTDLRGLEMRVWGDLKSLHEKAKERYEWLPGQILESQHAICTDVLKDDGDVRDMRKGLRCIPCMSASGQFIGISKFVGIKQKRRRLIGDEFSLMKASMLDSIANLMSGDTKVVALGNPIGQEDPLDKISEPKEGWTSIGEPDKTTVWKNRWENGRTINLVGTDSPNFDYPDLKKPKFPYLIHQKSIDAVVTFYGKDSLQYYSQCKGVRKSGINARRVITRELCEQFHAFDDVVWSGMQRKRIGACDAAYGSIGGDRCVAGYADFGEDSTGNHVLMIYDPVIVPVSIKKTERPEDQIAIWLMDFCKGNEIAAEDFGFDATGRGSLGTAFARVWSAQVEPVEFGGAASIRPVSMDLFVLDPKTGKKRLKLCSEHYSKFVSELWFTTRYIIEANQMRGLPEEVAREGFIREWKLVRGDRIEIETKDETKKRMGRSPDLYDWLVTICEMARRRGFQIKKLANEDETSNSLDWFFQMQRQSSELRQKRELNFQA